MSFKKIINVLFIVFFIAFSVLFCTKRFTNTPLIEGSKQNLKVYELWHIESFEGGGGNRKNYLNQLAINYEKQNPTILIMVKNINADQLQDALSKNQPHLISFSEEVAKTVLPYLISFNKEYNINEHYLSSSTYNTKLMAVPFIASGYCYFTKNNTKDNPNIYTANDNLHNATNLVTNNTINEGKTLSSYECYTKFVNSNNIRLLGTARDLFRIKNLENLGRFSINYEPVSTFSDLIQYLGKTTNDIEINKFVDFVMNSTNQAKLMDINLFSTTNLKLYTDPTYMEMENALKTCYIPNIFNQ